MFANAMQKISSLESTQSSARDEIRMSYFGLLSDLDYRRDDTCH
jgi:hypothetical protein